jgi:nitrite reductase/ring-hydroxylating ferredoxin subunit
MNWVKVLNQEELPKGARRVVKVDDQAVLLIHHQGQIYAVTNTCPHMGASLQDGKITDDGAIVCPRHHSAFDLHSGDVKAWAPWPPGVGRVLGAVSTQKALRVYQTRLAEDAIWVGV